MRKKIFLGFAVLLISVYGFGQDFSPAKPNVVFSSPGNGEFYVDKQIFLNTAVRAIMEYFRRYKPEAQIVSENRGQGTVSYGRYPVTIYVDIPENNKYTISIESTVRQAYIDKWIANIEKKIANYLR
ncbi:MAG: hypothetical protein LBK02_00270 [Treponema sp.]|jgi:hypothetical protein|nr:hypothetical protein [Treponema sp.]